ncbi:unnamed protein product [Calypogeia fissa]
MVPRPPSDEVVSVEGATLRGGATGASSNLVLRAATALVRSPLFSAQELMELGQEMGPVFRQAAVLCESGAVSAASAEMGEDPVLDPIADPGVSSSMEDGWQAAAARLEDLPARPAIDRARVAPQVVMVDNRAGIFQLLPAVVTTAESYDVLVGCAVLYPMGFQLDYWTEMASFRPGWQSGDGRTVQVPVRFIARPSTGKALADTLAAVPAFSGVISWPSELLEGNLHAEDTPVYAELEEVLSFASLVPSSLDVPLWQTTEELQRRSDEVVQQAWSTAFALDREDGSVVEPFPLHSWMLTPLDTTPIALEYPPEGVCVLDLFGGISTGLAAVLQAGIPVRKYFYVERDEIARQVSLRHVAQLMQRYPELLPRSATRGYQHALPSDIALLGAPDLERVGPVDLVIAGWPCQGHTRAGRGKGLQDPRSGMFYEMLRVLWYLQEFQARPPTYILENVPVLGDTRAQVLASVHQVRFWLGPAVLLDAASVGSRAHRPRLWWTNLLPREVLRRAFDVVQRPSDLTVDSILDGGRRSQVVRTADRSPMARVNIVGQLRAALPTLLSAPASYAYRDAGPGLVWDTGVQQLVEPNADERERAMGFSTGVTAVPSISEASRRQVLGQAMDLNCLTWIFSLGMAEQRRLRTAGVISRPLVSVLPVGTLGAPAGGEEVVEEHPWRTWNVSKEREELAAHAGGGVFRADGVPSGGEGGSVASLEVVV